MHEKRMAEIDSAGLAGSDCLFTPRRIQQLCEFHKTEPGITRRCQKAGYLTVRTDTDTRRCVGFADIGK